MLCGAVPVLYGAISVLCGATNVLCGAASVLGSGRGPESRGRGGVAGCGAEATQCWCVTSAADSERSTYSRRRAGPQSSREQRAAGGHGACGRFRVGPRGDSVREADPSGDCGSCRQALVTAAVAGRVFARTACVRQILAGTAAAAGRHGDCSSSRAGPREDSVREAGPSGDSGSCREARGAEAAEAGRVLLRIAAVAGESTQGQYAARGAVAERGRLPSDTTGADPRATTAGHCRCRVEA